MKKYLLIKADVNDGDYINSRNEVEDKDIDLITPIINAIKSYENNKKIKHQKWNWDTEGYNDKTPQERYVDSGLCPQKALDAFEEYMTTMDNESVHSIDEITIIEVTKETKLL